MHARQEVHSVISSFVPISQFSKIQHLNDNRLMENDIIEQQMHDLNAYNTASRRCLIRFQHFLEMVKVYGN